jgi:hypothetical protein
VTCREVRGTSALRETVDRTVIRLAAALFALTALAAGAAAADGPGVSATTNSVFAPGGRMYTTATRRHDTVLSAWRGTEKVRSLVVDGVFGFPVPTFDGTGEGLSHNGRTLLLVSGGGSRYVFVDARSLTVRRDVRLRGQFSYDALAPNGRTLFLIQRVSRRSIHYYVRAYDLTHGRLLPHIIFDAREKGEGPMSGSPVTRATGRTGRWIYTLYVRPSGALFVHALDAGDLRAYCVDLPRRAANLGRAKLELKRGRLAVVAGAKRLAVIDTKTLRLTS